MRKKHYYAKTLLFIREVYYSFQNQQILCPFLYISLLYVAHMLKRNFVIRLSAFNIHKNWLWFIFQFFSVIFSFNVIYFLSSQTFIEEWNNLDVAILTDCFSNCISLSFYIFLCCQSFHYDRHHNFFSIFFVICF